MSSLMHHGVKGQRWGVRRYQNKDGTRTAAGKKRYSVEAVDVNSSRKEIKKLVGDFSKKDKEFFFGEKYSYGDYDHDGDKVAKRFVIKEGKSIVAFIDAERGDHYSKESLNIVVGTAQSARGKGYASILSKTMVDWYESEGYKNASMLEWNANKDNIGSRKAAEKAGFKEVLGDTDVGYRYSKNAKKELDELSKAHMKVKAIDKEVSDKINSDFKKTKLSKISPNTEITPYGEGRTNWNSELGFYKSMIADHYATKWAKKNHAEDIAKYTKASSDWDSAYSKFDKKRKAKHTSIGGTMYIEGNALILGDSSYLEHHGVKGQRWGVRRFQNRDGSLTNAGRKRLGYATKGAAQTVGKAFKAGVKAGGNAVKAVKAHHEKKEAEKLQKKKEKASKTRIGVMANKDLFTNEEIRKLNERFKLEDEMKMATLQKGVEIAKAVGVIAQNVGTVAKAYEDVTGTSLSPIKKAKQEAEAKEKAEDRKRKLAKEDAETKRAEDKEKRDIEDRERRIKFEDEDRVRKQAKEDADAQRAENAEKRAQAKEQRDSSMAVELQRKAKAAADEQEHKAVKAKAESRSAILDVLEKIDKIQDHDDDDHNNNNPPGGGIDNWNDDDYLNFFKKTGIIHSGFIDSDPIQNGVLFVDSSDGLSHHGVKGQRWGVRRFQNEDGSLTEKGRKHYEKAIEKLDRKQTHSDALRGRLERMHPFAVTASTVLNGAAYASLMVASAANPVAVAAGTAVVAAVSGLYTHSAYSLAEAWEGRGTKRRQKKRKEYEEMLTHDGMYHVENGTLFVNAGEPYLEHHGVKGMKWGKHLMAGKGEAGAGGGGGEDDEKLKEMAKKAGMSVAEYKQKFASKIGGAASKVGSAVYDAAGGSHKKNAEGWRKMAREESNAARASERSSHENSAKAASQDRKYGSGGDVYRRAADSDKESAKTHHSNAKARSERAASEQAAYEKSLAGRYDKMKADRARKKSARQDKAFSGTSPKEKKRVARKDQYLALPEQKKRSRAYDNKAAETRRARAERLTRDSEIFNRAAEESKRKQNSALNKGNKREAEQHGKNANFAQDWAEEGRRGAKDWRTGRRTGKPVLRTDSLDQVKKQHDKTLSGKLDKARHTIQRGKQKVYNAAGGKYKEAWQKKTVEYRKDSARGERAKAKGDHWNASAAGSMFNIHSQEANQLYNKYNDSLAGRYDEFKEKRKKKKAKHSDDTNAVYTEGTRLVVNSKWG